MAAIPVNNLDDDTLLRRAFEILERELGVEATLRVMAIGVQVPVEETDAIRDQLNRMDPEELHRRIKESAARRQYRRDTPWPGNP